MGSIKIAGWSPYRGSQGVTANLIALGEVASAQFGMKVKIRANHFGTRSLENYISGFNTTTPFMEKKYFYSSPDYPDYSRHLYRFEERFKKELQNSDNGMEIDSGYLLCPPVGAFERESFLEETDLSLVDISGGNTTHSYSVIEQAEAVIIFVPGNEKELKNFIDTYGMTGIKYYFVVNCTRREERGNAEAILKQSGVREANYCFLPYSKELDRACLTGNVDGLVKCCISKKIRNEYVSAMKVVCKKVVGGVRRERRIMKKVERFLNGNAEE